MYWSDWGTFPKIERANMDGSDRTVLVSSGLVWVNSLALDFQNRLLYWCDAKLDKIERVDLQGNNRLVVLDLSPSNLHPFGLALADHVLYWSDWNYQSVYTYNMTSNVSDVLVHGMGRPMELHIQNQMDIYNSNYDFLIINLFFDERRQVSQVFLFPRYVENTHLKHEPTPTCHKWVL